MSLDRHILILGQPFNKVSGGGITLTNLFKEWDTRKIAVATTGHMMDQLDFTVCKNYYCLGEKEHKWLFPFNYLQRKFSSGKIKSNRLNVQVSDIKIKPSALSKIRDYTVKNILFPFLQVSGFTHFISHIEISKEFLEWFDELKPTIVYSQLSSLELILFATNLQKIRDFKLVLHFMDDWPMSLNKSVLFKKHWDKIIDKTLRNLINTSALLLSISEGMSNAYFLRYGKTFIPFHNPNEIQKWKPFTKTNWETKDNFSILYTGRIGTANNQSLDTICNVIDTIHKEDNSIILDIYTSDYASEYALQLLKKSGVTIHKPVAHEDMPRLLSTYDLLVLPLDFSKEGIQFARLSMPTKASEYMISGTPILIFASDETALVKHAITHKWACCVTQNNETFLKIEILKLYMDSSYRGNYGKIAYEYAIRHYDAEIVRKEFKELICKI